MNKESEWGWVHSGLWSAAARLDASFKCFSRKFMFIWGHSVRKQAKFISGWDIQRDSEVSVREMKIKDGGSRKSWPHPRGISEKKKKGDVRTCESVISSPNWTSSRDTALWLWQNFHDDDARSALAAVQTIDTDHLNRDTWNDYHLFRLSAHSFSLLLGFPPCQDVRCLF